ncbi:MAG TPA: T9SS type A sorting domain-containing protein [Cytophagaceae bacterium]|jgi:hypothetical protein
MAYQWSPTDTGIEGPVTGVEEAKIDDQSSFAIYPNPATENITVKFENDLTNTAIKVEIFDMTGVKIYDTGKVIVRPTLDLNILK